jgi:predicted MPP superfamily phosphohydrolase
MSRAVSLALFACTALLLTAGIHYYIWARLVRDVMLPPVAHRALTGVVILLFLSVPIAIWLGRSTSADSFRPVLLGLWAWAGFMFLLLVLLGVTDLGRLVSDLVHRLAVEKPPADPERRLTLSRMLGGGVALIAGGMGVAAVRSGLSELITREVRVTLSRLPPALDGTTIVQISDLHVGPTIRKGFVEQVVERTNALEPDVIAITGDLVDGSVDELREHIAPLGKLRAKYGVYFVTGNHEYYSGVEEWCAELTRLGIRVLRNERVSIGSEEASFDLAGVDDYSSGRFGRRPDLKRALGDRDPSRELVLLAHQPRHILEAEPFGVGLQLSGHTHGGQLWPWNYFVRLQQPVVSGLERIGQALVYVSNGTGYWGPPMRLGAPAEITRLVLAAAS